MAESMLMQNKASLWKQGLCWLVLLGPLFFLSYGQVNQFTATRHDVGSLVLGWEHAIPFMPWSIIPYWSIDLLYGISLFICTSKQELTRHGCRLVGASLVACAGFLLFPLQFSWHRPEVQGVSGWLFAQLEQFDLPYNQAPSLHIILTWLLWLRFRSHLSGVWRGIATGWFVLISISVLTTWQHHFVDVVSGFIVGLFLSYLIPIQGRWRWQRYAYPAHRVIRRYASGALLCLLSAVSIPFGEILLWPATALLLMTLAYLGAGESIWQKDSQGRQSLSSCILLLPVMLVSRLTHRYFCRNLTSCDEICHGLSIGVYPSSNVAQEAVLDLTAERGAPCQWTDHAELVSYPLLDLQVPSLGRFHEGVRQLDSLKQRHQTVLIHCALGMSRSALVTAGWLLFRGHAENATQAVEMISQRRACIYLTSRHLDLLEEYLEAIGG